MYEDMTYKELMKRCLARVPSTLDKREGSVIFDALAPACAELAQMYIQLSVLLNCAFPDTAVGKWLDKKAAERAVIRLPATYAVRSATLLRDDRSAYIADMGTRFSGGEVNYCVTEYIGNGIYKLTCETAGKIGNAHIGVLFPITDCPALASAEMSDVLIPGEDTEEDEALRIRYFKSLRGDAYGGNIADYMDKVDRIQGVGGVKVYPVWNGGGTVRIVIISSNYSVPSDELITLVQTTLDPVSNRGEGVGVAPIGHIVTVEGAQGVPIALSCTITAEASVRATIETEVARVLSEYLLSLSGKWADSSQIIVRVSQIEARILDIAGIVDVQNTVINTSAQNIILGADEIPTAGGISVAFA